jgi:hypothetical protein
MELTQTQKSFSFIQGIVLNKIFICVLLSVFAALGTIPYGYRFAEYLGENAAVLLIFGIMFAAAASLANVMLGTYSLLDMKSDSKKKIDPRIIFVSTVGSVPYGFLCYFGYQNTLPLLINVFISVVVVVVNAGIGFTAISNLILNIREIANNKSSNSKSTVGDGVVRLVGLVIGLAISVVMYLASSSGITDLLIHYNQVELVHYHAGFIIAIFSWIPGAALFANANQIVASELFQKVSDVKKFVAGINLTNIAFLLFCLASGTAIAQMTADSFDPGKNIPAFFKTDVIQYFVLHYLVFIALISSAALNYFSISKLMQNFKKK